MITEFLTWLEATHISSTIRQSSWMYPWLEIIHIFGVVLVAGSATLFDLLVLFHSRRLTAEGPAFTLLQWSRRGLMLAIPSGILLFMTNAKSLGFDPTFHLKLIFLFLAGINAMLFHYNIYLPFLRLKSSEVPWKKARLNAIFSILLWMSVISCGRLLAY